MSGRPLLMLISFCVALALVAPTTAFAAERSSSEKAQARAHFEQGRRLYNVNEFRAAYEEYKKSFLLFPDAALLFNMGQCLRQLGEYDEAIKLYRNYLRENAKSSMRPRIERQIAELQAALDAREKEEAGRTQAEPARASVADGHEAQPPRPVATEPPAHDTQKPNLTPKPEAPQVLVLTERPRSETPAPPSNDKPLLKRWWFWVAVSGVVALGVGAAAAAGAFTSYRDAPCQEGWLCQK